ncbi:MAG: DUF2267 domain-containing protein [Bacteroidales bacterium]|nr:DUF2267 domain-containing protein [Bacteroidales bacterium]
MTYLVFCEAWQEIFDITGKNKEVIMALNFDKYAHEGNAFVKRLAEDLGHPEEISRVGIILRAVLHAVRDKLTISESLDMIAQLPMFLKAVYVDNWSYMEKPLRYSSAEEFTEEVKKRQKQLGETQFDWDKPTVEIVKIVINHIGQYITQGELDDIVAQMPKDLKNVVEEGVEKK